VGLLFGSSPYRVGKKGSLNAKSAFIFAGFLPFKGSKNLINFPQGKTQAILAKD
jgi:hypothetical protein